jgi:hypothetical protein
MKRKRKIAGVLVCMLSLLDCSNDVQRPGDSRPAPGRLADVPPVMTEIPINLGEFHNKIMATLKARAALPMSISAEEFVMQLRKAANKAIKPYRPSREFTANDCGMVFEIWSQFVAPYFDVTLQDSTRSDPTAVIVHLREIGLIDETEFREMQELLNDGDLNSGRRIGPTTEGTAIAQEIRDASLVYWRGGPNPLGPEEEPPTKDIRNHLADTLGGLIGWALGFGNPLVGLFGAGLSLVFICGSDGLGGASGGGGGGSGWDPCHPHIGPPCD